MRTLEHHTAISQSMLIVQSRLEAIKRVFETFGKTPVDETLIDLLSSQAQDMLAYAQFLKTVEPAPPVVEPEPEVPDTGDEGDPGDAEPQP